jgi:hypothetical protein
MQFLQSSTGSGGSTTYSINSALVTIFVNDQACSATKIVYPNPVPTAMTINIPGSASQTLNVIAAISDTVANANSNPGMCGTYAYSLTPSLSFMNLSGNIISGSTSNVADIQVTTMTLRVNLSPWTSTAFTFTLTVTCTI